ncbi:dihydrodipicolinate reductase [Seohaeicola saemankumensis]|uniref:dihydrodipicolinate reductase n=1 Tax=Seohaeicola saemankumensis TaxID=481181 RepID=UPI001E34D08A|nr:dihydrodipicolinate reductase [Seohaeicola saemankumensis]MCD1626719.1 dihydrodipicolinate reductase [Seohaeicola saemankumensis]
MKPAILISSLFLSVANVSFAMAEEFTPIPDRSTFLSQVVGKDLRLKGYGPINVSLTVLPDGEIEGRGLGRPVTGAWRWQDGFFCRDLYWGQRDLGPNCQAVQVQGLTVRFIADQGKGDFADFAVQ